MSQASATMAMATTTPVTVVCSGTSSVLTAVTVAPSIMGLPAMLGQHDVALPPPLTLKESGGVVGLATVPQQQPQCQMPLQAYVNYAKGPPQVGFSFRIEPPHHFYMCLCLFWCMLSTFRSLAGCHNHLWELNYWFLHHCSLLELSNGRHMYTLVVVISPHQESTEWLLPSLL